MRSTPSFALCCIVKNESQNLARMLKSVKPHVDEMVIVDTGSEDDTIAIAEQLGAQVHHFEWCDDFSAARNYSLSLVTAEWILILDADEELIIEDPAWKEQLTQNAYFYALQRNDLFESGDVIGGAHLRLFKNIKGLTYEGRFHEQLKYPAEYKQNIHLLPGVKINHYGNSDENLESKNLNRDIPILELMRQEQSIDLWRLDCLARKYIKVGRAEAAQDCYTEALDKLTPNLLNGDCPQPCFWIPNLLDALGTSALENEDFDLTRIICQRGLEWFPTFPPLNYLTGEYLLNLGFYLGAASYFEHCLSLGQTGNYYKVDPFPIDFIKVMPAYALGLTHSKLGNVTEARAALNLALSFNHDYKPAFDLLGQLS